MKYSVYFFKNSDFDNLHTTSEGNFTVISNSNYSISGGNKYYIKNEICYVFLQINATNQTGNWVKIASGLPNPHIQFCDHISNFSSDVNKADLQLIVYTNGNLNAAFGTTGGTYAYTLSYPIA